MYSSREIGCSVGNCSVVNLFSGQFVLWSICSVSCWASISGWLRMEQIDRRGESWTAKNQLICRCNTRFACNVSQIVVSHINHIDTSLVNCHNTCAHNITVSEWDNQLVSSGYMHVPFRVKCYIYTMKLCWCVSAAASTKINCWIHTVEWVQKTDIGEWMQEEVQDVMAALFVNFMHFLLKI